MVDIFLHTSRLVYVLLHLVIKWKCILIKNNISLKTFLGKVVQSIETFFTNDVYGVYVHFLN